MIKDCPAINSSNLIFSGGLVLAALGIRFANDIDVFHTDSISVKDLPDGFDSHNHYLDILGMHNSLELFLNPANFFSYCGYKFLSPRLLIAIKMYRPLGVRDKDKKDIVSLLEYFKTLEF